MARQPKAGSHSKAKDSVTRLGFEADFGPENADIDRRNLHPDLRVDTATRWSESSQLPSPDATQCGEALLQSNARMQVVRGVNDNSRKDEVLRWQFGVTAKANADFAWVRHFISQRYSKENQYVV